MTAYKELRCPPSESANWKYWSGKMTALDGGITYTFAEDDVAEILYHGDSGEKWDGDEAVVLKLKNGRLVAWEIWWGPTGNGFHEDAYGGDAHVYFGLDLNDLVLTALTDKGRRMCGIPAEGLA